MWPEEAAAIQESGRSLTELRSVGPFTAHFISAWLRDAPDPPVPPPLRDGFITYAYACSVVDAHPEWRDVARADHQMHTDETDGSSTIEEMAATAAELGRQRIAITDHSKTLRITNGMDEARLRAQGEHIAAINADDSRPLVLRSIEMDLTPEGAGDMDPQTLAGLDLVLGAFHSKLRLRRPDRSLFPRPRQPGHTGARAPARPDLQLPGGPLLRLAAGRTPRGRNRDGARDRRIPGQAGPRRRPFADRRGRRRLGFDRHGCPYSGRACLSRDRHRGRDPCRCLPGPRSESPLGA